MSPGPFASCRSHWYSWRGTRIQLRGPRRGSNRLDSTKPPNATDDVLLFADIIRVIAQGIFLGERIPDADELAAKLRAGQPPYYTPEGERRIAKAATDFVVIRPQFTEGGQVARAAIIDVLAPWGEVGTGAALEEAEWRVVADSPRIPTQRQEHLNSGEFSYAALFNPPMAKSITLPWLKPSCPRTAVLFSAAWSAGSRIC